MARRNPPPPPPRRSGPPSNQRVQTSLARVRQIAKSVSPRDRPFDPGRRGTWQGSSRDLVVNGSYEVRRVHKISPRDTDRETVHLPQSAFSDKNSMARALREAGILESGARLREFRVEGDKVVAFPDRGIWHSFIIDMDSHTPNARRHHRNGSVDPRDIPAHLHGAELREEPDHNGQDVGYSQGLRSRSADWYQVEYATGSDYSGGSVHESNYKELCAMLEEAHPEDSEPVVWARTSGGHGTYGVVVRYGDLDEEIRETLDALKDYPIISDEGHSLLEMEQQDEAWERDGIDDLSRELAKIADTDRDELKDGLTDSEWYSVFNLASDTGGIYWEDQQGAGPYVDMRKIAKQVVKLLENGLPGYATNEQADAYDKLGHLIGEPE